MHYHCEEENMKTVFEEYGGMILACMVSLGVLAMNVSFFVGPVADAVIYIVENIY